MSVPGPGEVDALLLDLGNVVVKIDFDRVVAHWARSAGIAVDDLRARFSHDEPYKRHERDEIPASEYFASLRGSLGVDLDDARLEEGWNAVFVDEIPEVVSLLPRLASRLPLYVFSNTNRAHHRHFARRYAQALSSFREVFVSHELGARKPDPDAFRSVARAIGVPPRRILFFDDLAENVAGARAAGMPGVLVSSPNDFVSAVQPWLR